MKAKAKDLAIAKRIKKELKNQLGDKLISVILYGSRARGEDWKESDMDLFLLMKKKPGYFSPEADVIFEITDKYLDRDNIYVSPVTYGLREYKKYKGLNFLREVSKGIKL